MKDESHSAAGYGREKNNSSASVVHSGSGVYESALPALLSSLFRRLELLPDSPPFFGRTTLFSECGRPDFASKLDIGICHSSTLQWQDIKKKIMSSKRKSQAFRRMAVSKSERSYGLVVASTEKGFGYHVIFLSMPASGIYH